jgi:hypothetical protein
VDLARRLFTEAGFNGMLITESVYLRIDSQQDFHRSQSISSFGEEVPIYEYVGHKDDAASAEVSTSSDEAEGGKA